MKNKALLLVISASVLWGTSGIFVHYMAPLGFSSLQMVAVRCTVAAICFFVYILLSDRKLLKAGSKTVLFSFAGGISMYLCGSCYYISMQMTSISTAVMLMYTAPVIVIVYAVLFMGEKLTKVKLFSIISMLVGCAFISGVFGGIKFNTLGIIIGLMSGVSYSAYNIFTKIEMQKKINPVTAAFYCFLFAAIISLAAANPVKIIRLANTAPAKAYPLMIGIGICTYALPYFFYTLSLKHMPVGTASALGITEPMAATVFSVILFHEPLSFASVCGIVLILGAVFLLGYKSGDK